jgi:hypothetical protein
MMRISRVLTSNKGLTFSRKQLAGYCAFRRNAQQMLNNFCIQDQEILTVIDERIKKLEAEIEQFELAKHSIHAVVDRDNVFLILDSAALIPQAMIESRLQLGWPQTYLARAAELHVQQICRYERTEYQNITFSNLTKLTRILINANRERQLQHQNEMPQA